MWKLNQRVTSRTEPDLGCGIVTEISSNWIEIDFPLKNENRRYGLANTPLNRISLSVGQKFFHRDGNQYVISEVKMEDGVAIYITECKNEFGEWLMDARPQEQGILDSLASDSFTDFETYDLRKSAWQIKSKFSSSPVSGFIGPRVDPLGHQLYIASQVIGRTKPRVLLADEVGLGKTIEAGLIISALKQRGRSDNVLIIVPEALTLQWVHEMYRRFNLLFTVIDDERIEAEQSSENPFSHHQLNIASAEWLTERPDRVCDAVDMRFDLVVFDEAHHIHWDYDEPSEKWRLADQLARSCEGLLLLTATPRQYGLDTQFGLLNLIDPQRFSDFDEFAHHYEMSRDIAAISAEIAKKEEVSTTLKEKLLAYFDGDEGLANLLGKTPVDTDALIKALTDRHGIGRLLFRNRRAFIGGFPERNIHLVGIEPSSKYLSLMASSNIDTSDPLFLMDYATGRPSSRVLREPESSNERLRWIGEFIQSRSDKILIIASNIEAVLELANHIEDQTGSTVAIFHEKLSVVERDTEAARFADDPRVQVMVTSEIGGEGRNFQFANILIMGDIPRHPDLVEQRIGRLDRIGQKKAIEVYVPFYEKTPEQGLVRWYEEGLNAFKKSWNGTDVFLGEFADDLFAYLASYFDHDRAAERQLLEDKLIENTKSFARRIEKENQKSVDFLVDLNSYDKESAGTLIDYIDELDDDPDLEFFVRSIFDHYGVDFDDFDDRGTLIVRNTEAKFIENLPGLKSDEDTLITFDRTKSQLREDMVFLTGEHPTTEGMLGLLLERNEGVLSAAKWENSPLSKGILLEFTFLIEAIGAKELELNRFLHLSLNEWQCTHEGKVVRIDKHHQNSSLLSPLSYDEHPPGEMILQHVKPLYEKAAREMEKWAEEKISEACKNANTFYQLEVDRLSYLSQVNPLVTPEEVEQAKVKWEESIKLLKKARPRIDSLRILFTS